MFEGVPIVWVETFQERPCPVLRGLMKEEMVNIILVVVVELGLELLATKLKLLILRIVIVLKQLVEQDDPVITS